MASNIRDEILEESQRLFYEQGYNKTSLRQIAEACGIKIGNLYYYFKKKIYIMLELEEYKISRDAELVFELHGEVFFSYNGLIATQYLFFKQFADHKTCRAFIEASAERELVDKCVQIHQDMMIKLVGKEGLKISPHEAFYANNYACAGEIQMLNYYYTHETAADLDDMIKPCLYTRLLMLGLSKDEARLYTEKGIELAMSVLQETERDQNGIGTRAVTLFNE